MSPTSLCCFNRYKSSGGSQEIGDIMKKIQKKSPNIEIKLSIDDGISGKLAVTSDFPVI